MRPIERIDVFLDILREKWKEVPDQRFGQFIENYMPIDWYIEEPELLKRSFPHIRPQRYTLWGTRGKDGKQPVEFKPIADLETEHLFAILETQKKLDNNYTKLIQDEIKFRTKSEVE